jgi:hypothetical protein
LSLALFSISALFTFSVMAVSQTRRGMSALSTTELCGYVFSSCNRDALLEIATEKTFQRIWLLCLNSKLSLWAYVEENTKYILGDYQIVFVYSVQDIFKFLPLPVSSSRQCIAGSDISQQKLKKITVMKIVKIIKSWQKDINNDISTLYIKFFPRASTYIRGSMMKHL